MGAEGRRGGASGGVGVMKAELETTAIVSKVWLRTLETIAVFGDPPCFDPPRTASKLTSANMRNLAEVLLD